MKWSTPPLPALRPLPHIRLIFCAAENFLYIGGMVTWLVLATLVVVILVAAADE